jgi:YD repeat-containing protein
VLSAPAGRSPRTYDLDADSERRILVTGCTSTRTTTSTGWRRTTPRPPLGRTTRTPATRCPRRTPRRTRTTPRRPPSATSRWSTGTSPTIGKTSPEGRTWAFGYDAQGNLTTVTDPAGTATTIAGDFTTTYGYDPTGQLLSAKDANGNTTSYSSYDPNGYPQTIADPTPQHNATTFVYDVRGNVLKVTDALNHDTRNA